MQLIWNIDVEHNDAPYESLASETFESNAPAINSRRFHINRVTYHQQYDSYQMKGTEFC